MKIRQFHLKMPLFFIGCFFIFASCNNGEKDMVFDAGDMGDGDSERLVFTKRSNSDWEKSENQDRISENVWLTRAEKGLLFNCKVEASSNSSGPTGTQWIEGKIADFTMDQLQSLKFTSLKKAANAKMKLVVGKTFIVNLLEDNIYIELTFLAWGDKSEGGGFSYSRSIIP
tara:strand:+ start:9011 stop:9523 length:513 start_codon:yes stop_codon:yes gene_type:complete